MKITFDPAAVEDLDDIFAWIEKENPRAGYDVIARIQTRIDRLARADVAPARHCEPVARPRPCGTSAGRRNPARHA
jgi:plasmid stabilization system protein ParE